MNKFYDLIVAKHKEYVAYNTFLEKIKLEFRDKRKEAVDEIYKLNETATEMTVPKEFTEKLYNFQVEEQTYMQDLQSIFYTLYLNVKTYLELGDGIILPKEITELCESLEYVVPRPFFIIDENGEAKETEKGRLEQRKNSYSKEYDLDNIQNIMSKVVQAEIEKNKEENK